MQCERRGALEHLGVFGEFVFENDQASLEGLAEALFFLGEHADDEVFVGDDIGVRATHDIDGGLDEAWHHQTLGAQQIRVSHGATNDATQHIATTLVAGEHAVVDQHRAAPRMLGKHAQAEAIAIVVIANAIALAGNRRSLIDERRHHVGFPHTVFALHQREDALEAGTRIDRWLWQRRASAIGGLVELHEHEVPELHEPIALRIVERTAIGTEAGSAIDMQFAARTTRTGIAHLPEVVFVAQALNAVHRHAHLVVPDLLGLVVAFVHSDPDAVAVESEDLGHQFPTPRDGIALEVITEAEVAEHLEEDKVTLRATDIVEVVVLAAGACALLSRDSALERRRLVTHKIRLEGHHASNREQHRWVMRNEARRRNWRVPAVCEEACVGVA